MAGAFIVVFNRIPALIAAVEANARSAVKSTADSIAQDARARAPVDTGFLKGSIESVSLATGKSAEVRVGAYYGPYVEFGTYKMAAQPFLYPAAQAHADEFIDKVGRGAFG